MASVKVFITGATVGRALNTPGGPVWELRERALRQLDSEFNRRAPVGKRLDATHRTEPVGRYKRGVGFERYGNQSGLGLRFLNRADHAGVVEYGRDATNAWQRFGWRRASPPGKVKWYSHTGSRDGKHVMRNSVNTVMPRLVTGYTPLP
jgi:hypothetical protein